MSLTGSVNDCRMEIYSIGFIAVSFGLVEYMISSLNFDIEQYINDLRGAHEFNLKCRMKGFLFK